MHINKDTRKNQTHTLSQSEGFKNFKSCGVGQPPSETLKPHRQGGTNPDLVPVRGGIGPPRPDINWGEMGQESIERFNKIYLVYYALFSCLIG